MPIIKKSHNQISLNKKVFLQARSKSHFFVIFPDIYQNFHCQNLKWGKTLSILFDCYLREKKNNTKI